MGAAELQELKSEMQKQHERAQVPSTPVSDEPCAIIGIDYQEYHPETYRAVIISFSDRPNERFDIGDVLAAMAAAKDRIKALGYKRVFCASSVDHFAADVKKAKLN
jgi:hypothetical protein